MENKIIEIIFDKLANSNLYNYANDEDLKNIEIRKYTNLLNEEVIGVRLCDEKGNTKEDYIITCTMIYKGNEEELENGI